MGAYKFDIQLSAAQTATGNGGAIPTGGVKEMAVYVDVTAQSGTTPVLTVFLQSSSDGGITWYDCPFEAALETAITSAEGDHRSPNIATDVSTNKGGTRNIIHLLAGASVPRKSYADYFIFGDLIRAAWVIAGTTPSFTFSMKGIGKN